MAIPKKLFNKTWAELSDKQKKNIGVSKSEFIRQKKAHSKSSSTTKPTPSPAPTTTSSAGPTKLSSLKLAPKQPPKPAPSPSPSPAPSPTPAPAPTTTTAGTKTFLQDLKLNSSPTPTPTPAPTPTPTPTPAPSKNTDDKDSGRDPDDVGNLKRISQDNFGTSEADDAGIIYKTYDEKGGGILKIGNMPGHRTKDSPYADIKIIDYDATIANYDPAKSLKGMKVIKSVDDKGNVTFKTPKIKRITDDKGEEITGDTFRTEKRKKDYAERGLNEGGGQITKFKIGGEYKKIKTNKDGTLKRLTLTSGGKYKETNSSFPAKLKTDSFSDLLKTKTGLKFNSGPNTKKRLTQIKESLDAKPAKFSSDSRNKYISQGRKSLNDKDPTT